MDKRFLAVLGVLLVGFFGLLFFNKGDSNSSNNGNSNGDVELTNHVRGEATSGVILTEWGDFQCPACAQYYPLVKQLKEEYGDKVGIRFRHFPLQTIHQNALISSRAAEAAALQDKFFEMHDLLYENQNAWAQSSDPTDIFVGYADQLELDTAKFEKDMKSNAVNQKVRADLAEANKRGYSSTPTFDINGEKIENPRDLEGFKKLIDEAIAEKKQ